jgi:PadR family transcriptional regulator, regulatory protein AphA
MDRLSPTGRSILGYLSFQERSGYDIRQAASRNLVWGVSDGQLYPQLRELHANGLIEPSGPPNTVRARQRWRLTDRGRAALRAWVQADIDQLQMRDENLAKLLFADQFGADAMIELLRRRREIFVELKELKQIAPGAHRTPSDEAEGRLGPGLVHGYGLDFADFNIDWCDRAIAAVRRNAREP